MTENGGRQIVGAHARAVVHHTDFLGPGLLDRDIDLCGAGIERILDQLLDHRGRAFDHLPRRDLVDQALGENGNNAVGFSRGRHSRQSIAPQPASQLIQLVERFHWGHALGFQTRQFSHRLHLRIRE